jgi:hypothetical protein
MIPSAQVSSLTEGSITLPSAKGTFTTNDFYFIASGTGTGNTITLSSIPSTYKNLRIYYTGRTTAGSSDVDNTGLNFNGDTTSGNYKGYYWGTGEGAGGNFPLRTTASTSTAGYFGAGWIDIQDYSSTSKYKPVHTYAPCVQPSNAEMYINYTTWINTNAITSITWGYGAGNFVTGSKIDVYGYN